MIERTKERYYDLLKLMVDCDERCSLDEIENVLTEIESFYKSECYAQCLECQKMSIDRHRIRISGLFEISVSRSLIIIDKALEFIDEHKMKYFDQYRIYYSQHKNISEWDDDINIGSTYYEGPLLENIIERYKSLDVRKRFYSNTLSSYSDNIKSKINGMIEEIMNENDRNNSTQEYIDFVYIFPSFTRLE